MLDKCLYLLNMLSSVNKDIIIIIETMILVPKNRVTI